MATNLGWGPERRTASHANVRVGEKKLYPRRSSHDSLERRGGMGVDIWTRPWRTVLLKVAYYATSSAQNFAKLCQDYARIPKKLTAYAEFV